MTTCANANHRCYHPQSIKIRSDDPIRSIKIRGSLARSSSAFRLGAGAAVVFLATIWPSFVSSTAVVWRYKLFTGHGCRSFFEGQLAWGDPNSAEASTFCNATRISFAGTCLIFLCMHCQVRPMRRCRRNMNAT